jgi:hypothetical protein
MDNNLSQFALKTDDGWRDLICGLDVKQTGGNIPVLTSFRNGLFLYAFADGFVTEAFATAHLQHDYKLGTMIYPHFHWSTNSGALGTVRWGFEYTWARRADSTGQLAFPATTTIYVEQAADGTPYKHYVAESPDGAGIPADTIQPDTVILFRVFRDGAHVNDTFNDIAFGFTFDLHYQADRYATPSRFPPFYA